MADPLDQPTATIHDDRPADIVAEPPAPPAEDDEPFDKARAMALIDKLRGEVKDAKAAGREAAALKDKLREIEDSQLSEQEKIARERDELKAEKAALLAGQQETNLRLAVYAQQQALGIADTDLAIAALDRASVVWEDGRPTNITDVLVSLLDAKPLLRGAAAPAPAPNMNAGGGQAATPAPALTADELSAAQTMGISAAEYHAFKGTTKMSEFATAAQVATPDTTP